MSKWKDVRIQIVKIVNNTYGVVYGLGNDSLIYEWDKTRGKWLKHWSQEDDE